MQTIFKINPKPQHNSNNISYHTRHLAPREHPRVYKSKRTPFENTLEIWHKIANYSGRRTHTRTHGQSLEKPRPFVTEAPDRLVGWRRSPTRNNPRANCVRASHNRMRLIYIKVYIRSYVHCSVHTCRQHLPNHTQTRSNHRQLSGRTLFTLVYINECGHSE